MVALTILTITSADHDFGCAERATLPPVRRRERRPPRAATRPGSPAPTIGLGTATGTKTYLL